MPHNLTETTERTSGHTGEVLVSKQRVLIHTTTNLLLVITSRSLEEVHLMATKDCPPLPLITTVMQIHMDHMQLQSHPALILATKENVPHPAQPIGAGLQVMADTALMNKESLLQVLMEAAGDPEVHTESL